jgi:hypothetical protein
MRKRYGLGITAARLTKDKANAKQDRNPKQHPSNSVMCHEG